MAQNSSSDLDYWTSRLQDKESCLFPTLSDERGGNKATWVDIGVTDIASIEAFCQIRELKVSTILQTAWGLVLRSYTAADEVSFGFKSDYSTQLLPCILTLVRETSLRHALDSVEATFARDSTHLKCSLKDIEHALDLPDTGLFNTIVNYWDGTLHTSSSEVNGVDSQTSDDGADITNGERDWDVSNPRYMIEIDVKVSMQSISMQLKYEPSALSKKSAANVASALEMALQCIMHHTDQPVGEQSLFSPYHQQQINEWNQIRPETINMTLHEAISQRAQMQPEALAVNAWDEKWTFGEVDKLSSILALHLVNLGVEIGMKIPLVFERSGWWVIALLAVSKAGAAFVPVEPKQPVFRLEEIMQDIEPKFLLSSSQYAELLADVVESTIVVSSDSLKRFSSAPGPILSLPIISPDAHAYVMFTSGSTGRPKGAATQHGGYLAALKCWVKDTEIGPGTMALQASSYAWTVCVIETICSLWCGACLCIPSDYAKLNDFPGVFDKMQISWAILSPSIIKSVHPESAPSLKSLILCGEPVSKEVVSKWASERRRVWVAWASTECLAICKPDNFTAGSNVQNLGPCNGVCRVVDVKNPDRQVPIGAVGEIVVHGPWIAHKYLKDPEKTARTFLDRPEWLHGVPSSYGSRWYRAGDLVRQNADGSLMLAGRGDNMVKIRGQRFDMSEIERNLATDAEIRNSLPVLPKVGVCKHRLVAVVALHQFTTISSEPEKGITILRGSDLQTAASWVSQFCETLAKRLPSHAIPTIWVMVKSIPLTITGKIDRNSIKRFLEGMDVDTYEAVATLGVKSDPPVTAMEKRLQSIWGSVLDLAIDKIGRNQSFISLGGDSILAMIVGAKCRSQNLSLRVEDILKLGTISEIALHTTPIEQATGEEIAVTENYNELRKSIKNQLHEIGVTDSANVEDAYPCSPMQQGMLLSKARLIGEYNTSSIYELVPTTSGPVLSANSLRDAWQQVVDRHSILRTFFVESVSQSGSIDQVVLKKYDISTTTAILDNITPDSLEDVIQAFNYTRPASYGLARPPHNFTVLPTTTGKLFYRLNIEHTLVDGMAISLIARDLNLAYHRCLNLGPPTPYSSYIALHQQVVCSVDNGYWKGYLDGMNPCLLPNLTHSLSREPPKIESRSIGVNIKNPHHLLKFCQNQDLTLSALFRAIWGLILRRYTGSDEICFGFITSGRDVPVDGIEELVGPTINMLICRLKLEDSTPIKNIIATAQADYLASLPHQHASLAQIQHVLGLNGQQLFNTSMTVLKEISSFSVDRIHQYSPNEYDLDVQAWVSNTNVKMELWYRTESISNEQVCNIASTFSKALETITDDPDQRVGQLDLFSDHHRQQVWKWNAKMPETVHMCLHDLITIQAKRNPQAVAIQSWERSFTWMQLETYSDQLAHHLVSLGIGPEVHVMLCFEKSALAIVAMLAALKAGSVVVSIDSSHPIQRLQRIIKDTRPLCCLVSPKNSDLLKNEGLEGLIPHTVEVQESLFSSPQLSKPESGKPCPEVRPENAAFVLFTSGSTGTPKGIVHEHRTVASSLEHHGKEMQIGVDSRTMQFSAFVFDVSITEIFMSLTRGGVLCIPSEDERMNNLESAFTRMEVNWAHLTPTVASLLLPDKVPTLKHLVLAGEPLKKVDVTEWAPRLELVNLYGPAECALATTLRVGCVKDDRPDNIGRAVGLLVWIVNPSNTDHLVPVGAVGEILLEGPNVAREYLKDKERTLGSFIENPAWLNEEKTIPPRRFYKSGDLAKYNSDGSIQILGRIDTQVKLYGQRVELSEIEYQAKLNLSTHGLVNMAVVYAKSEKHPGGGLLAVLMEFEVKAEVDENQLMLAIPPDLRKVLVKLNAHLTDTLPTYMVPSVYVPLNSMPLLTVGKIDRGRLTRIVTQFSRENLKLYSLSEELQDEKEKPRTRMERTLHKLWAQVLDIDGSSIGVDDNFFRLGGDSVVAMRLSAAGRKAGITITVTNIFQHSKLSSMAAIAKPFSETTYQELEKRYNIPRDVVQDIIPCTPLQEGLMLLSSRQPGTYVVQHVCCLPPEIDMKNFSAAWEIIHHAHSMLSSRIIHVEKTIGSMQVVLDEAIVWQKAKGLEKYLKEDKLLVMDYGQPLTRYALINEDDSDNQYFVWTAHHSVFDSWSLSLLFSEVGKIYEALSSRSADMGFLKPASYKLFAENIFNMDISAAESFWNSQFLEPIIPSFPRLPAGHQALTDSSLSYSIAVSNTVTEDNTLLSTTIQAAWSLLVAQYSDSPSSVVFGMTWDGRNDSDAIPDIDNVMGPTIATVPFSVSMDYQVTIKQFLINIQEQKAAVQKFQHFGLQNIKALGPNAAKACDFQSLLAIQDLGSNNAQKSSPFGDSTTPDAPSTYLLLLDCQLTKNKIDMTAQYDQRVTSNSQIERILQQFEHVLKQLLIEDESRKVLVDIEFCGPEDLKHISSWNQNIPLLQDACVHDIIAAYAANNPNAAAVCSWDNNLTYSALNQLSTTLAYQLITQFGIGPESLVPLLFTQSAWAVVAMLAVLKAGGGYVPMDPSYPRSRLQEILDATRSSLILCSPQHSDLSQSLADAFVVSREIIDSLSPYKGVVSNTVNSKNVAYVIFTSGSTGKPKGVVMEHGSFCTAATNHGKRLNLNPQSRVIHFSSYAFEACILEILTTLFNGGCVCVAPESERLGDITKTMREFHVNWAFFTPSFIRTIHPDQVPDLKTLVLGGEALGADNIDAWVDRVFLVNGYGPSETCIFSVTNEQVHRGVTPDLIGSPIGGACWIVDPKDYKKLVPVGCIGELLVEGPTLSRGYLNDPEKTKEVFVKRSELLIAKSSTNPNKLMNGTANGIKDYSVNINHKAKSISSTESRMYKTGDLVRYNTSSGADGTIIIIGRKDAQVKIRGQRTEMRDIEYHLKSRLEGIKHVAVEYVAAGGRQNRQLAAFFPLNAEAPLSRSGENATLAIPMPGDLKRFTTIMRATLSEILPMYMIPTLYVTLSRMPLLSSGKTDRRRLHDIASNFSSVDMSHYSLADEQKRVPKTEKEIQMSRLWRHVLALPDDVVTGIDDSFFGLGGDSISAMRLTTLAREHKSIINVAQIFNTPRLEDMAVATLDLIDSVSDMIEPFSLIKDSQVSGETTTLRKLQQIYAGEIDDAFPCGPLQEGLMLLSIKHPGSYMSQITLKLRPNVDINRFKEAWQATADRNPILRTRITYIGTQCIQFVTRDRISWRQASNLESFLIEDKKQLMGHGSPLVRYAIVDDGADQRHFILTAHHSLYDGWSLMLVMEELDHMYYGPSRKPTSSYSSFIKHLNNMDLDSAEAFWKSQFTEKSLATFPDPRFVTPAKVEAQLSQFTRICRPAGSEITLSTVIRAAWALVTARYADTNDVFFGATLMGRNASLPNIERITGPTITTVPICVSIDNKKTVGSFLCGIQSAATDMMPFEHTGLQNIKLLGPEAEMACSFQNLLVIQPEGSEYMSSHLWGDQALFAKGEMVVLTYALIIECRLYKDEIRITAQYRDHIIPTRQMQRIMDQFEEVLGQLNEAIPSTSLSSIDICSRKDKDEVRKWNESSMDLVKSDDCIHHLVQRQANERPYAPAIESWDAKFTYAELDNLSTELAHYLSALGVGTGNFVPLCFDKSAWTIVAILAVLKVGGAYVSLDPKHPIIRKEYIIRDVCAKVILTGTEYRDMFDCSTFSIVVIDEMLKEQLPTFPKADYNPGSPTNAAFVVFTSGSTGIPKGIVMEHGPFCSSSRDHCKALQINQNSRVMQFAAYTYDVSMGEILSTLIHGGCVCVPSEEDKLGRLAISVNALRSDWIFLTPTVAALLKPEEVPGLKTMVLGGEHATAENFKTWASHLHLINSYGPAECAIWCACAPGVNSDSNPSNIGNKIGASLWVIDASNPDKLAPIGCVGELVVEGPTLAREYLNDTTKTAAAFIENPKWASNGHAGKRRMYRTGDLVRYGPDGNILIVGRRDTQVKIHGQRIELGEIEHHVVRCTPPEWFPVIHILNHPESGRGVTLAALIHIRRESTTATGLEVRTLPITEGVRISLNHLRVDLEQVLPSHMIPSAFILVSHMPLTAGGKVDRAALREIGESLTEEELRSYFLGHQMFLRSPSTDMEKRLHLLWTKVLNIDAELVGAESNFLRIGGDSVAAMKLSASARENGISLAVRDIFIAPKLEDMSKTATLISPIISPGAPYIRFSSLNIQDLPEFIRAVISSQIPDKSAEIEDILKGTDYQRWVLGCSQLKTRGYNNYFTFRFKGALDLSQLQVACKKLLDHHPILRTVFITNKRELFQVVLKNIVPEFIQLECPHVRQSIIQEDMALPVLLGQTSIRFICINYGPQDHELLMRVSHGQYDGISLPILVRDLKAAYCGQEFQSSLPYSAFIHGFYQTTKVSDAEKFWGQELEGSEMTNVLAHKKISYSNPVNKSLKRIVPAPSVLSQGITFATVIKTAWAFVLAQISGNRDVVFGQITTGRNAPIQGIDEVVGPCMNLIPVRVSLDAQQSISDVLQQIQNKHLDMSAYESLGFQDIIEKCTNWPKWTRFSSVLQHTNFNIGMNDINLWGDMEMNLGSFTPDHDVSDIWIWTGPTEGGFSVDFTYSSKAIPAAISQEILERLCDTLTQISEHSHEPASLLLSNSKPLLPLSLPETNGSLAQLASSREYQRHGCYEAIVEETWAKIFGDENDNLPSEVAINTPFFDLRGDLLAAAQLSMAFQKDGFQVSPEEMIDNASMRLQAALLSSRDAEL